MTKRAVSFHTDPIAGPIPRSTIGRGWWRLKHRLRSLLGLRRGFKVPIGGGEKRGPGESSSAAHGAGGRRERASQGVYYKEISTELLGKAFSRRGKGEKEYRVTFPDGTKMRIHCSLKRPYADVMGPVMLPHYERAQAMIRPGMRVLTMPSGTGYAAAWLAERVGPSGAVVAIEPDRESTSYAQRRYPRANVAFEQGGPVALAGEVDGAFHAGFVVHPEGSEIEARSLAEVWRVVAPGGWLLAVCSTERSRAEMDALVRELAPSPPLEEGGSPIAPVVDWLSTDDDAFHVVMVRKVRVE